MALPRVDLGFGWDGAARFPAEDFIDLTTLVRAVIEGCREYPAATLAACDYIPERKVGFHLEVLEGENYRWWEFRIHAKDLDRTLDACLASYPGWAREDFKTSSGRVRFASKLVELARGPKP